MKQWANIHVLWALCLYHFVSPYIAKAQDTCFSTVPVNPFSVKVYCNDSLIPANAWYVDWFKGCLYWKEKPTCEDLRIDFDSLHVDIDTLVSLPDPLPTQQGHEPIVIYNTPVSSTGFLPTSGLTIEGQLVQELSSGTNQNLNSQSYFGIVIKGDLTEDLTVEGHLSDQSLPIQPEGNTYQLQDFDRIYLRFTYKDRWYAGVGDQLWENPEHSYFLRYKRKIKGLSIGEDSRNLKWNTGIAFSRGKYSRISFYGKEGVRGPYPLVPENKQFIIILSGTERVYLDGKLLTRGADRDYVIDYNKAEITFTPAVEITAQSRIVVEFQYTTQEYARMQWQASSFWRKDKVRTGISYMGERDNVAMSNILLDSTVLARLGVAGDNDSLWIVPAYRETQFQTGKILYRKVDTIVNGIRFTIFVYESNPSPTDTLYEVSFTYVGLNKGNYVLDQALSNGKIYRWVAPQGGIPQGAYEPIVKLLPPSQQHYANAFWELATEKTKLRTNVGLSYVDLNILSPIDDEDNSGFASKVELTHGDSTLAVLFSYEMQSKNFLYAERFKEVEFYRNWQTSDTGLLHLVSGGIRFHRTTLNVRTLLKNEYVGISPEISSSGKTAGRTRMLAIPKDSTTHVFIQSAWKHKFGIKEQLFIKHEGEYFNFKRIPTGWFRLSGGINTENIFSFEVFGRIDAYKKTMQWMPFAMRTGILMNGNIKNWNIQFSGSYIDVRATDTLKGVQSGLYINSQVSGDVFNTENFALRTYFKIGRSMAQRQSYQYVKVPRGQGQFAWKDFNGDGIQQITEFVPALYQDEAEYIRVWLPTLEYVPVNLYEFSVFSKWTPANAFNLNGRVQMTVQRERKWAFINFNPITDTLLRYQSLSAQATAAINQNKPVWGELIPIFRESYQWTTAGSGFIRSGEATGRIYLNAGNNFWLVPEGIVRQQMEWHEIDITRQYVLLQYTGTIKVLWRSVGTKRVQSEVSFAYQEAQTTRNHYLYKRKWKVRLIWRLSNAISVNSDVSLINQELRGDSNEPVAYYLLEGIQQGTNGVWTVFLSWDLNEALNLNLSYNGRTSTRGVIHNGTATVRYVF
ncbi:MAG: DUF2460 domain-containing protein [Chlorobi bacterium]|nr:DUF2460 domain-containing protein [Chlorobiota bacterium]